MVAGIGVYVAGLGEASDVAGRRDHGRLDLFQRLFETPEVRQPSGQAGPAFTVVRMPLEPIAHDGDGAIERFLHACLLPRNPAARISEVSPQIGFGRPHRDCALEDRDRLRIALLVEEHGAQIGERERIGLDGDCLLVLHDGVTESIEVVERISEIHMAACTAGDQIDHTVVGLEAGLEVSAEETDSA